MGGFDAQINIGPESAYGTYVAPTRSYEFAEESISSDYRRIFNPGQRAGAKTWKETAFAPVPMGAAGSLTLQPLTKGFGLLLNHMLGTVSLGTPSGGKTLQTHTLGELAGKSLDVQVFRPYVTTSGQCFTYLGTKFPKWKLSCEQGDDGLLVAEMDIDAREESTSQSLVAAAYPSGAEPFVWANVGVQMDAADFCVGAFELEVDRMLDVERYKMCATAAGKKSEPIQTAKTMITGSLTGADFTSMAVANKVRAASAADALAAIVITCVSSTDPTATLTITLPKCVINTGIPTVSADGLLLSTDLTFTALEPTSGESITIAYNSTDTAI
jgi:hypothetical protein